MKIVTHNGSFHADDLFACATLKLIYPDAEIVRTRDEEIIKTGDIVLDVGNVYDPGTNRFDHHQKAGAGVRENTIPYASFGLIWKHFGLQACGNNRQVWEKLEKKIVMPIDAIDNGVTVVKDSLAGVMPYTADQIFLIFSPTWKENEDGIDQTFMEQVERVKPILLREIEVTSADIEAEEIILNAVKNSPQKEIVTIEQNFPRYLYQNILSNLPDILFVIMPRTDDGWKIEAIKQNPLSMESRQYFPESWRGLRDADLEKVTGVEGAYFCHRSGFFVAAHTKEAVLALGRIVLNS